MLFPWKCYFCVRAKFKIMKYLLLLSLAFMLSACNQNSYNMDDFHKIYGGESIETYLNEISNQNVIFGHQSVGGNILSGITFWEKESGIKLNRTTSREFSNLDGPRFVDFLVGANGKPSEKIDDFATIVKTIPGESNTIAFFKFCYVDINEESDIDEIFNYLKDEMLYLKKASDQAQIVLITVPLTTAQKGWKAVVKKVLRRMPAGYLVNIKRQEMNKKILNELSDEFPIFDLARVESTLPSGRLNSFKYKSKKVPCLSEVYASDYGHLNGLGSYITAYNLLAFLATELK